MGKISKPVQIGSVYRMRAFMDAAGKGLSGLTLAAKVTDYAGNNIASIAGLLITEINNIPGDYEVDMSVSNFSSRGPYTIRVTDANDPAAEELVEYIVRDFNSKRFTATGGTSTTFTSDLGSLYTVNDSIKTQWLVFDDDTLTQNLRGVARRIVAYTASTGLVTISSADPFPASPQNGEKGTLIP